MESDSQKHASRALNQPNFSGFLSSFLPLNLGPRKISDVFSERPTLKSQLHRFHPVKSATLVAGLLTEPSFHANTLRLELLVHLLMAFAAGNRKAKHHHIYSWLNTDLGSTKLAFLEDPVEDVFVSNVTTQEGNVRLFEGTWESSDFYLQTVLNVVERLPVEQETRQLKREVRGLLKLSEEIAARRGLGRFTPGEGQDKGTIQLPSLERMNLLRRAIVFSAEDLNHLGILSTDLEPFVFHSDLRLKLRDQSLGDSDLERRPIVHEADSWFILLPAAISVAVRQHILYWISRRGYDKKFDQLYAAEYENFFKDTPILGPPLPQGMPLQATEVADKTLLEFSMEVDAGRYLHMIAIVDSVQGYMKHGFSSPEPDTSELGDQITQRVKKTRSFFGKQEGFKQGLSLLVSCGYGRPSFFYLPEETQDWRVASVSAPDLATLGWVPEESPLILWKLVERHRFVVEHGISIGNANGLLNLYGWWSDTKYSMLHPEVDFGGGPVNIMIPTDCLTKIRLKVRQGWDVHALPYLDGSFVRVRRATAHSYFPNEASKPHYSAIDAVQAGELLGAWVGERFIWWVAAARGKTSLSRAVVFRVWATVNNWLEKAVPIFEREMPKLSCRAVLIELDFNEMHQVQVELPTEDVLRSCLSVSTNLETTTIRLVFSDPFFGGFRHPKNIAERAIVRALTDGVLTLGKRGASGRTLDMIFGEIVPNEDARHIHLFEAAHFRDYIQDYDRPGSLFIDDADEARSKLGLGWLVRDRKEGDHLTTAKESVRFLNAVVEAIWQRMRAQLHRLDRRSLIEQSLRYIEGVEADRIQWQRTIRAVLALRDNDPSVKTVAVQQMARFNAATITLRLVTEMAVSESPLNGGKLVGVLDLTALMADAFSIFHIGGWSDAIWKGVMDPEIRIAANGEILSDVRFRNEIVEPFGLHFASAQLDEEASKYEKHFEPVKAVPSIKGVFPDEFLMAVEAEFGLSFDALRGFRDALENLALEKQKSVFIAPKADLLSYCAKSDLTSSEVAKIVLDRFALWPREAWDHTPKGFKRKDWYPWRFGRRLSLISRPLVRLESGENPRYVISPGLIGISVIHALRLYFEGVVPQDQCASPAMKRWVSEEVNRRGHAFAQKVFETMQSQNYQAHREIKLSTVLNEKLDRDLGDIDVLAWKPGEKVVLAIECKDLKFAKTPNEIAEQLTQFSGQVMSNGERDDLLKHVDRCDLLKQRYSLLARFIGMPGQCVKVKALVCFSHPVPMQHMSKRFPDVTFLTIDEL